MLKLSAIVVTWNFLLAYMCCCFACYYKENGWYKGILLSLLSLSLLVCYVTCNDISVIYVTAQMCRRIEEKVVSTVGLPMP